jgi:hypothetical protein
MIAVAVLQRYPPLPTGLSLSSKSRLGEYKTKPALL